MAIIYSWQFPQFEVIPSEDGLSNVVKIIHWRYNAVDGEYRTVTYGMVTLPNPNEKNFVPYSDITEEWAIDAVSQQLDVPAMQAQLSEEIELQKNPPIVSMTPPFAQN